MLRTAMRPLAMIATSAIGVVLPAWYGNDPSRAFAQSPVTCTEVSVPVSLEPGSEPAYSIAGTLCRATPEERTLQILYHGGTYDRTYWDFPYRPERYSYVQNVTAPGRATLAIDRLGQGRSSPLPALTLTIPQDAFTLHQVVQAARRGAFGGPGFRSIVLVGHSLGSVASIFEASEYQDIDGLIITGLLHKFYEPGLAKVFAHFYPAQLDPKFQGADIPPGNFTTVAGRRSVMYHAPQAESEVIAMDEATKSYWAEATEGSTFPLALDPQRSASVKVPVLVVVGEYDVFFCTPVCGQSGSTTEVEPSFWETEDFQLNVVPRSGHSINLQLNAQDFYADVVDWMTRHFSDAG